MTDQNQRGRRGRVAHDNTAEQQDNTSAPSEMERMLSTLDRINDNVGVLTERLNRVESSIGEQVSKAVDDRISEQGERFTRADESRAAHEDEDREPRGDHWEEPLLLSIPRLTPRPGYVQRWVRTEIDGVADESNVARMLNKGWQPRMANTVPQGIVAPILKSWRDHSGVIGVHGMVLMERTVEQHERQARYVREHVRMQMQGVNDQLRGTHEPNPGLGAPTMESRTRITRGRRPRIPDDA